MSIEDLTTIDQVIVFPETTTAYKILSPEQTTSLVAPRQKGFNLVLHLLMEKRCIALLLTVQHSQVQPGHRRHMKSGALRYRWRCSTVRFSPATATM